MKNFDEIEAAFFTIKPGNYSEIILFYNKYESILFDKQLIKLKEKFYLLNLLYEVINAFSFSAKHKEAINLFEKVTQYFDINTNDNKLPNNLNFCLGLSYFETNRYRLALVFLKKYQSPNSKIVIIEKLIKICKSKILGKILLNLAFLGVFLVVLKNVIKWLFVDYYTSTIGFIGIFGLLLLFPYLLFINFKKNES